MSSPQITHRSYDMELQRAIRAVARASRVCERVRTSLANISVSKDDKCVLCSAVVRC